MSSKKITEEYLSKQRIKDEYEFTDAMIRDLLPAPELTKPNPHYRTTGAPMQLWLKSTVEKVVATDEFAESLKRRRERSQRAKASMQARRTHTLGEYCDKAKAITVVRIPLGDLEKRAVKAKEDYEHDKGNYGFLAGSAPDYVRRRWMVNYVRHNLTVYDRDLHDMKGKVGVHEGYEVYKSAVLDEIATVYPELAEECDDQKIPVVDRIVRDLNASTRWCPADQQRNPENGASPV